MANPLLVRAARKAIMKSPAGKRLKKKGIEGGKKLVEGIGKTTRNYIQKSTSNSTVKDGLTKGMMRLNPSGQMSRGIAMGVKFGKAQAAKEGVKAALVSGGAGYLLGKKKKK
tara:strand:+ start:1846 stop:2181 length:336 start_codon:yes stop_codon:yes gene_type:complete